MEKGIMPRLNFLKKPLILFIVASLTACMNSQENTNVPSSSLEEKTDQIVTYNIPGKTDNDHLYLEEVLGEQALSEVKSWNARTLDRLTADPLFEQMNNEVLLLLIARTKSLMSVIAVVKYIIFGKMNKILEGYGEKRL
jgi:prolyl oligopeptidase